MKNKNNYNLRPNAGKTDSAVCEFNKKVKKIFLCALGIAFGVFLFISGACYLGIFMSIIFIFIGFSGSFKTSRDKNIPLEENIQILYGLPVSSGELCAIMFDDDYCAIKTSQRNYILKYFKIESVVFATPKGVSHMTRSRSVWRSNDLSSVAVKVKKQLSRNDSCDVVFIICTSNCMKKVIAFKMYNSNEAMIFLTEVLSGKVVTQRF